MYTTPLSTLISSLSLNHYLYADDTQLFFSFHPRNFDSSIAHLQTALQLISYWMSANILTLNSSKTEFLIIGLKQQLSKIDKSSLNTTHSARNLGFYPRDAMLARVIAIATCLSVRLSVRLSVTRRYCVKTKNASGMISSPSGSPKTLVF